jgi:hypothetical protein
MSYVRNIGINLILWAIGKFVRRPKFGKFLILEDTKNKILEAAKRKEETFPDLVISYISAAFLIPKAIIENLSWEVTFSLFMLGVSKSAPSLPLPILHPTKQKKETNAWDYDGRVTFMYNNIIAKAYGWSVEYVNNLDVDTALALIQEILTDEQLEREFLWAMSDKSYSYDTKTKSGKANPLERPYFMKEEVKEPKRVRMPASLMPQGFVDYSSLPPELRPH